MSEKGFLHRYPKLLIARAAVGVVLFLNIQCSLLFFYSPGGYAASFELTGTGGVTTIRGIALLFLMWNIPYIFALLHPIKHKISYLEACLMQTTGLIGEALIMFSLPAGHAILRDSIGRFIWFDAVGLVILCIGFLIIPNISNHH